MSCFSRTGTWSIVVLTTCVAPPAFADSSRPTGEARSPGKRTPVELPAQIPFDPAYEPPPGYVLRERPNRTLLKLGTIGLLASYGASAAVGTFLGLADEPGVWPFFVPLAGPFVGIATADMAGGPKFWLGVDGVVQVASLGALVAAGISRERVLVLRDPTPYRDGLPFVLPPPRVMDFDGRNVPRGYHVETRADSRIVVTGAALFAGSYGISALVAATGAAEGADGEPVLPLFWPVVGPAITMGTTNAAQSGPGPVVALAADALVQVAGIGLLVGGALTKREVLVRDGAPSLPTVNVGPGRVAFDWSF